VIALEYYDSFFRRFQAELAEYTERCIEDARAAFAAAVAREAAEVQRTLSEKVAETSVAIARRLAERPVGLHRVTMLLAAVVAFGALCVNAGYSLAAPVKPFWVTSAETLTPMEREAAVVLAAPAGWMVFALLLPAAVYGARVGWGTASEATRRRSSSSGRGDRACGAGVISMPSESVSNLWLLTNVNAKRSMATSPGRTNRSRRW
jgi:hypothetical protein